MSKVRTLIVVPISLEYSVVEGCITNYVHRGAVVLGSKKLEVNQIPRHLLKEANGGEESGLGGFLVVFEAEELLRSPVTFPKSYASPTVEDADKYIGYLFNLEELE